MEVKNNASLCRVILFTLYSLGLLTEQTAGFSVKPESVVQAEGLEAVFECLYPGASSHIWAINGEFLSEDQFPPDVTRISPSGSTSARLIIPATSQYNNTVVQCEAIFREGGSSLISVLSCLVILRIQGEISWCVLIMICYYNIPLHMYNISVHLI